MKRFTLLCILLMAGFAVRLSAQTPSIEIKLNKDTILMGNQLKVSFILHNTSGKLVPPDFDGFQIVNGPFTSSSYSFINGEESRKMTYTYILEPLSTGLLGIGSGYIAGDENLRSNEIPVYIKENPEGIIENKEPERKSRNDDFFEGFGAMRDMFTFPDDFFESKPRQSQPVQPPKKTYKFKTEKI